MQLFFADDSQQKNPSRPGMDSLVAIGGISVPDGAVRGLEQETNALCADYGFPDGEEFKWSPGRKQWMHRNLTLEHRTEFFIDVLTLAESMEVKAIVVIEDEIYSTATNAPSPLLDVTSLFLERANTQLHRLDTEGIVIVDQPGGNRSAEEKYLRSCFETLLNGTDYVKFDRIALNVLSTPSHFSRLLQVADVVTSCTVSMVSGETNFSPPVFAVIKRLLDSGTDRVGGVGLKIHPDYKYINLYYWLLDDSFFVKDGKRYQLPLKGCLYYSNSNNPS